MLLGKKAPKVSFQARRFRLGVAHHGAPSAWMAPVKDTAPERESKPSKKNRR